MKTTSSKPSFFLRFALIAVLLAQALGIADTSTVYAAASPPAPTAIQVFGQGGHFNTNVQNNGGIGDKSLSWPFGVATDGSGNLYVTDTDNNRVLYFPAGSTIATRVYGTGDSFTTGTVNKGGVSANSLWSPTSMALDSIGNLYVADFGNNRVLYYPANRTEATRVYGQGNFNTRFANFGGVRANTLYGPSAVALDSSDNLYVADGGNSRVLYYSAGSTLPTRVYGQGGYATGEPNHDNTDVSADTLAFPWGLAVDSSNHLYVADRINHRVLYYPAGSTTATRVYGQGGSFTTKERNKGGVSASSLDTPNSVAVDSGGNLFVADLNNSRVLYYQAGNTTASHVYGQGGSFTTNQTNKGGISADSLVSPDGVTLDGDGNLYVADRANHRVLQYGWSDTTAPSAAPVSAPAANPAGWNNSDVTVAWNWADNPAGSGIDPINCVASSGSVGEGAGLPISATCSDLAGNVGDASVTANVDKTLPAITASATAGGTPYVPGTWTNQDVTVAFDCTDTLSGVASCSATQTLGEGADQSASGTATDAADNSANASLSDIDVDRTPPTITASATSGGNPYIPGTWTNQDVTVTFACIDDLSGVASVTGPTVISAQGFAAPVNGVCVDNAGNSASTAVSGIQIDKTSPALAPAVSPNSIALNGAAIAAAGATDALSGVASSGCGPLETATPGLKTVACAATDLAGNAASASATYLVSLQTTKQAVLDDLTTLRATVTAGKDGDKLDEAIKHLTRSLDPALWIDYAHLPPQGGAKVFNEEKGAINKLDELIRDRNSTIPGATLQGFIGRLALVDRFLATVAIADAVARPGDPNFVNKANAELAKGDGDIAAGKFASGIEHYRNAWQHAQKAME